VEGLAEEDGKEQLEREAVEFVGFLGTFRVVE